MHSGLQCILFDTNYLFIAYKHQAVREEDVKLQVMEFGGRLFGELMLVFGASSSPGIFDDLAKVIKELAIILAAGDERLVQQHLDDVVNCGTEGYGTVNKFYRAYREVVDEVGVSLADGSDPDKAFSATYCGKVLGVEYNLREWRWWLPENKLVEIVLMLARVRDSETVWNGEMLSLNGKLNHYMWLIPGGAWQRGFLLQLQESKEQYYLEVRVTDLARIQADWWMTNIMAARESSPIPDPRLMSSMTGRRIFSDAAGGAEGKLKNGAGGLCPPYNWFYMPWPAFIRENRKNSLGVRFASKLSTLEGFAALISLATIPDIARNSEVELMVDNDGFVKIFAKKHSSCPYAYTIAKAIYDVSLGLACKVWVTKTARVSGTGEVVADALSKGDWERAWPLIPVKNDDPDFIPLVIRKWIMDPVPDMALGQKILAEMSQYTKVLHLDY